MIGQYLSNKNKSATVAKSEFFFGTKQGLNKAKRDIYMYCYAARVGGALMRTHPLTPLG